MAVFQATIFQLPIPFLLTLFHPHSHLQWPIRILFLLYAIFIATPVIFVLVPLSILLGTASTPAFQRLAPLPVHQHNLPPYISWNEAVIKSVWVYVASTLSWAITSIGSPPVTGEEVSRNLAGLALRVCEGVGRLVDLRDDRVSRVFRLLKKLQMRGKRKILSNEDLDNDSKDIDREAKRRSHRLWTELKVTETRIQPLPDDIRIGAVEMRDDTPPNVRDHPILGFWLTNEDRGSISSSRSRLYRSERGEGGKRKVYLFFAGGGYVTGWPLVHPFLFSLARNFPSVAGAGNGHLPMRAIFAPDIRRANATHHCFPIPILDGLAAYVHLRKQGYAPEEIVLTGDSAGGGMVWSVIAFLTVWNDRYQEPSHSASEEQISPYDLPRLGIPGGMILISPWLSLPPVVYDRFPDLVNEPQLCNAARSYLARYPVAVDEAESMVLRFGALIKSLPKGMEDSAQTISEKVLALGRIFGLAWSKSPKVPGITPLRHPERDGLVSSVPALLHSYTTACSSEKIDLGCNLTDQSFSQLNSHHPFVSPSSESPAHPLVTAVLRRLAANGTKLLLQVGTAEWFFTPSMRFYKAAETCGMAVLMEENVGGVHIESCLLPGELGGGSGRMVKAIERFMDDI